MKKSRNTKTTSCLFYTILFICLVGANACKKEQTTTQTTQLVKVTKVQSLNELSSITYPGKIKAAEDVKLAFRVAGPIKQVYVNEGQKVRKGQVLAELDTRDYRLQYDATSAEYEQIKGESDRVIELYKRGSVSINEYDKAIAAKKRITALYNSHRNALNDTRLKAPFDGFIQNKYFSYPEIINQGTPVLSMINDDYFDVNINISADDFMRRNNFNSFYALTTLLPNEQLPLELIDISQEANYNQLFKVRFRMKKEVAKKLAAGMSVTVNINCKPEIVSLSIIPLTALFQQNGNSYVWIYDAKEQAVQKTKVDVEQINKEGTVLVKSNLKAEQMIVSAGVNGLKEGQKVKPLPQASSSNIGKLL